MPLRQYINKFIVIIRDFKPIKILKKIHINKWNYQEKNHYININAVK